MYTDQKLSKSGRDMSAFLYAFGCLVAAAGTAYLGVAEVIVLRYRRLVLPTWTFYIAAALLLGLAVVFVLASATERCVRCNGQWLVEHAYFPLETREQVVRAVKDADVSTLAALPVVPKNQMKMHLTVSACKDCGETGDVELVRWENYQPHTEIPERNGQGPTMRAFRDLTRKHAHERGDEEE